MWYCNGRSLCSVALSYAGPAFLCLPLTAWSQPGMELPSEPVRNARSSAKAPDALSSLAPFLPVNRRKTPTPTRPHRHPKRPLRVLARGDEMVRAVAYLALLAATRKEFRMPGRWLSILLSMSTLMPIGCTTARDFPAPGLPRSVRLVDAGATTARLDVSAVGFTSDAPTRAAAKPLNVLVLSGGGMNGAFPAGLLNGWTESGARPEFDVVTGISAGALIAPFAFLGSEYDAALARNAALEADDIYRRRPLPALPWADSLADSQPLWQRIQLEVTDEFLVKIAHAHAQGRRLYVGTTNLDTNRPQVWDLGAIAAGDNPNKLDLFRKVLLASSSVPGLLPPVAINVDIDGKKYSELHVDGGVSASLFLHPQMLGVEPADPHPESLKGTVTVIVAGKLSSDPTPTRRRLFQVSGRSISGLLQAQLEGDLLRVYLLTLYAGSKFALAAVPADCGDGVNSLTMDAKQMRCIFEEGRRFGSSTTGWKSEPPGIDPRDWQSPRNSVRLTALDTENRIDPTVNSPDSGPRLRAWLRQMNSRRYQHASDPIEPRVHAPEAFSPRNPVRFEMETP